jgi:hypothetical protein
LLPRLAGLDRIDPEARREASAYLSADAERTGPAGAGLDSVPVRRLLSGMPTQR